MEIIKFLDYEIRNSSNETVIVKGMCNMMPGASHFGEFTKENIDKAKEAATILFMIDRPDKFSGSIYYRLINRGGAFCEYFTLKEECKKMGIEMPDELKEPLGGSYLIGFNGKPLNY